MNRQKAAYVLTAEPKKKVESKKDKAKEWINIIIKL